MALAALTWLSPAPAEAQTSVDFRWRRAQTWEYVAAPAVLGAAFALRFAGPAPEADWRGGILFDDAIRDRASLDTAEGRRFARTMTDIDYFGSMAYRFVDSVFVPGLAHGAWDTSLQMTMIDLEAFGVVAISIWGTQAIFGRERPLARRCGESGFPSCESVRDSGDTNRSFYAGHPAVGMTAAGLTCMHHSYLPLYGGGAADTIACGTMVGAAVMNGFGRVMIEKHYATDLVVGFGVGAFAGWVLPYALHYAHPVEPMSESSQAEPAILVSVMPFANQDTIGVSMYGIVF